MVVLGTGLSGFALKNAMQKGCDLKTQRKKDAFVMEMGYYKQRKKRGELI